MSSWRNTSAASSASRAALTTTPISFFGRRRRQDLDHRVGVDDGRRLERRHDEHALGEQQQLDDVVGDAGGGVDEQEVETGADAPDDRVEPLPLLRVQRGQRADAAAGRNDPDAERALDRDLVERLLAGQHVAEVMRRREAEQHVDVAEAEVGVEDADAMAEARQRHGQVDDDVGLADAALAAGDGDDRAARGASSWSVVMTGTP